MHKPYLPFRFLTALILLLSVTLAAKAQVSLGGLPDWENPRMIGQNKEPGHAQLVSYNDVASALADSGLVAHSPYRQSMGTLRAVSNYR